MASCDSQLPTCFQIRQCFSTRYPHSTKYCGEYALIPRSNYTDSSLSARFHAAKQDHYRKSYPVGVKHLLLLRDECYKAMIFQHYDSFRSVQILF